MKCFPYFCFGVAISSHANCGELAATQEAVPSKSPIRWRMSAGAAYRSIKGIDFNSGSYSQGFALPLLVTGSPATAPFEPEAGLADRIYNDGFVRLDESTLVPGPFFGTTSYFSYQNAGQIQGENLVFQGSGTSSEISATSSLNDSSWRDKDPGTLAPQIEIAGLVEIRPNLRVGPQISFSYSGIDTSHKGSSFNARQTAKNFRSDVTDSYALNGVIPPVAPYTGTYTNAFPEPVIDAQPTSRVSQIIQTGSETADFFNNAQESLDLHMFSFALGSSAEYEHGPFFVAGSLGVGLNVVDWQADFDEELNSLIGRGQSTVENWEDSAGSTDILWSLYFQTTVGVKLNERWSIQGFGRYDWSQNVTGNVGPSSFSAELSGWTVGTSVGFSF